MAKRCNHKMTRYDWGRDAVGAEVAISRWCLGCGAQLGIGPSNEEPETVKIEMRAAELEDTEFWAPSFVTMHERFGIEDHEHDQSVESDRYATTSQYQAGFMSREIETWSISRPIAEQLAETARNDAEADAMEYEVTRDAEPDCRDEDDTDEAVVCSCAGDALTSDRCEAKS